MRTVKDINKELKSVENKIEELRKQEKVLKDEKLQIQLGPARKKYEGRYYKIDKYEEVIYIEKLQSIDNIFINYLGFKFCGDEESYLIHREGESIIDEGVVEISKEEFRELTFGYIENLKEDYLKITK